MKLYISLESNTSFKLYRVEYDAKGIYQVFFDTVKAKYPFERFKTIVTDKAITWLDKPYKVGEEYPKAAKSYFTEAGLSKFKELALPYISKWLDKSKIKIIECKDVSNNIYYKDAYQVVVRKEKLCSLLYHSTISSI